MIVAAVVEYLFDFVVVELSALLLGQLLSKVKQVVDVEIGYLLQLADFIEVGHD